MSFIETKNSQKKDAKKNFIDISIENNSTNKNKNFNKKNNVIIENIINSLDENEIQNNSNLGEDDYNYLIYNESISKNKIIFPDEQTENFYLTRNKTISSFRSINKKLNQKYEIFDDNCLLKTLKKNSNKNVSSIKIPDLFENDIIPLNEEKNDNGNYNKLMENINIFHSVRKDRNKDYSEKPIKKSFSNNRKFKKNENYSDIDIKIINVDFSKKSKYSKRNKKKETKKCKKDMIPFHNRATTQFLINLNYPQNKNQKSNNNNQNYNNISKSNKDLNNPLPKLMNFKIYDAFIMSSNYKNNLTERDKEIIIRNSLKNNKSIRKIDVSISRKVISKNLSMRYTKPKNNYINFINLKKHKNPDKKLNTIIKDYNKKEPKSAISKINNIQNLKSPENLGSNKIIKKRVVLEEEYIINSKGDKMLLSVKRVENGNNNTNISTNTNTNTNTNISNSKVLEKYFKKEKRANMDMLNVNKYHNLRHTLNNSLFNSVFNETSGYSEYNRTNLKSIEEDQSHMDILNNYIPVSKIEKIKKIKQNIITSLSPVNDKNNKIIQKMPKKAEESSSIKKVNLNKKQTHEQKTNSELNNKEIQIKKKLFYNKICPIRDKNVNKFNKSNNNSNNSNAISSHTNFLNSNRVSTNYYEEKNKYNIDNNKSIYERISFVKEQPLILKQNNKPHNKNQNFFINNNQNCPNLVNIVFYNQDEKNDVIKNCRTSNSCNSEVQKYFLNKKINIPMNKLSCRLKRNNYKFHEIKSVSIDITPRLKSTRNYNVENHNKLLLYNNSNSCYEFNNMNYNTNNNMDIYSSMDSSNAFNLNNNYYIRSPPSDYSRREFKMIDEIDTFNKRASANNNCKLKYYKKYID